MASAQEPVEPEATPTPRASGVPMRTRIDRAISNAHGEDPYAAEDAKAGRRIAETVPAGPWQYRTYSDGSIRIVGAPKGSKALGMLVSDEAAGPEASKAIREYVHNYISSKNENARTYVEPETHGDALGYPGGDAVGQ